MTTQPRQARLLPGWLGSVQGRRLLAADLREVRMAMDGVFGDEFLQIGSWGDNAFVRSARTRRARVVSDRLSPGVQLVSELDQLAIAPDSVDAVLLAHTLDIHHNPHAVLREVDRILRPDGHLLVLGFNPGGTWGVRRLLSRGGFPPGLQHMISERRLKDWLRLLDFRIRKSEFYHFQQPFFRVWGEAGGEARASAQMAWASHPVSQRPRRIGSRFAWPVFAACYALVARKQTCQATLIRPGWRKRPRLVGGLVNPTTRNVA